MAEARLAGETFALWRPLKRAREQLEKGLNRACHSQITPEARYPSPGGRLVRRVTSGQGARTQSQTTDDGPGPWAWPWADVY